MGAAARYEGFADDTETFIYRFRYPICSKRNIWGWGLHSNTSTPIVKEHFSQYFHNMYYKKLSLYTILFKNINCKLKCKIPLIGSHPKPPIGRVIWKVVNLKEAEAWKRK